MLHFKPVFSNNHTKKDIFENKYSMFGKINYLVQVMIFFFLDSDYKLY